MANALEEISREHLECAICCELYTDPRLLPCLHSFCTECLFLYLQHKNTIIECPTCRQTYNVTDGDLMQFPINFPLRNLVEAIGDKQKELEATDVHVAGLGDKTVDGGCDRLESHESKVCESCGQTVPVVARCHDCDQGLCQFCKEAHLRVLAFKGHKVSEIVTIYRQQKQYEPIRHKCSKHPNEEGKYFCLTCGVMVCSDCAVTEHRTSEHQVVGLKEATKNRREFLRRKVDNVLVVADEMDKRKSEEDTPSPEPSGKGDPIETTRRARNACQVVTQALDQSDDDDIDFLVLFGTLDAMLRQICDEFIEAGYLQTDGYEAADDPTCSNPQLPPLLAAFQTLSLNAAEHYRHLRPFLAGRHHRPPPHHPPPPGHHPPPPHSPPPPGGPSAFGIGLGPRPRHPGCHGPPPFGMFHGGPFHHPGRHRGHRGRGPHHGHHRGRGRGGKPCKRK